MTPAAARLSLSLLLRRPGRHEQRHSTVRGGSSESVSVTTPVSSTSHFCTFCFQWKTMPFFSMAVMSAWESSGSMKGSSESWPSMTWTFAPSAAKMQAYSLPITPGADHRHRFGNAVQFQHRVGVVNIALVEGEKRSGRFGEEPVASRKFSPRSSGFLLGTVRAPARRAPCGDR